MQQPHPAAARGLPVVFVPSERVSAGDTQARLVLRQLDDGALIVPAYSSLEALVRCCGKSQSWVCLPADGLPGLLAETGAAFVVLDAPLLPEHSEAP